MAGAREEGNGGMGGKEKESRDCYVPGAAGRCRLSAIIVAKQADTQAVFFVFL